MVDFDAAAGTVAVTGKVVRQSGKGLHRIEETKTAAGRRTIPLPSFAVAMLTERRKLPFLGGAIGDLPVIVRHAARPR